MRLAELFPEEILAFLLFAGFIIYCRVGSQREYNFVAIERSSLHKTMPHKENFDSKWTTSRTNPLCSQGNKTHCECYQEAIITSQFTCKC
ncbi:hypothetical protein RJ641_031718 [Dillenia turbinata]|uniref:Uncharacterized protein n=1 Tax=Dillenia turbinata TaxID=194707 RepID=A0AAN8VQ82_9MAGN